MTGALAGKVAIVTGASRGIGAVIARAFAQAGADLVLGARSLGPLEALADELTGAGHRAVALPTDVTDEAAVQRLVARSVEQFGRLDAAVNNAGGGFSGKAPIAEVESSEFRAALELNLTAVFLALRHQIPAMIDSGGGAIVNMSSGSGFRAFPGMGTYVVAKHGLHGLTKLAALDYAAQGVRVNALAPGPIMAGPLAEAPEDFQRAAATAVPMQRIGRPEEVAAAAVWLCSDAASFVTGATLPLDGGQLAQ
jgi:NAD(P)-dependent dehydrogenase (short-subunit alcohol dehydrogenase family)